MSDLNAIVETLSGLTLLDQAALVKIVEEKWNVSAAGPVSTPDCGSAHMPPRVVVQTEFSLLMTSFGAKKIDVIKEIRLITGLDLKSAKDLVERVPAALVKEFLPRDEAEKFQKQLVAAGATVEMK